MSKSQRSRSLVLGIVAVLTFVLVAPIAVHAEDQVLVDEQVVAVDEQIPTLAPVAASSWSETSGYGAVEATRALAAQRALLTGDHGSLQEERLYAIVAAARSWDETSGYGSVEASRALASGLIAQAAGGTEPAILDKAELLAQFRAIERFLSRSLGAEQPETASCGVVD
jgi:hypothetical protein